MHNLKRWAFCLLLLGCNQERNKSIEAMNQGVEAGRQKLYDRAISQLQQAISLDPSNDQAYYNLGVIYKDQKKPTDAAGAFENAVKHASDNPSYHYELASALLETKKFDAAKAVQTQIFGEERRVGNMRDIFAGNAADQRLKRAAG